MMNEKHHKALRFEAIVTSIRSRVDGSLGLGIVTPELLTEEKVALMDLQNVLSEMIIMPKDEKDVDMLEVRTEVIHKSPSQRQRSVIFLLWKQTGEEVPFEVFYGTTMEKIIEYLKSKLPPVSF
jgi:hypothetical protein